MTQKLKKTTTKISDAKLTLEKVNTRALTGMIVALCLVGYLGIVMAPPGFFTDFRTGGIEGGNCFLNAERSRTLAKIITTSDEIVVYEYVDRSDGEIGLNSRPNNHHTSTSSEFDGFSALYKYQVRCSEYDKEHTATEIFILKKRLDKLEIKQ